MNAPLSSITERITETLDRLERELPSLPASWVHLNRTVARAGYAHVNKLNDLFTTSLTTLVDAGRTSGKTVVGQARAASDQVVRTATTSFRQVAGQAEAQRKRFADVAGNETSKVAAEVRRQAADVVTAVEDTAAGSVKAAQRSADKVAGTAKPAATPAKSGKYETWSKADLYARAQELDLEGRTAMSKSQLIKALRAS